MSLCAFAPLREILPRALLLLAAIPFEPTLAEETSTEVVLNNLRRPMALAVRPGGTADSYEVYIAESGSGQVLRWSNRSPDAKATAVEGFESDDATSGNPLSLAFLDPGLLVVGGERDEIQGLIRIFELSGDDEALSADKPRERVASTREDEACLAFTRARSNEFVQDQLIAVVRASSGNNRLRKLRVQAGTLGAVQPFVAEGESAAAGSALAVATSPMGRIVAVGTQKGDSTTRLTFFNPIDGSAELSMPLDLPNVVALAYSPSTDSLYAADRERGIHRIDDTSRPGKPSCRAEKIADVANPTALAFAPDGTLYLTVSGDSRTDGKLLALSGDF